MRKLIVIIIIIILITTPCFADYRFAVIGDTRDYSEDGINNKVMKVMLEGIKSEGVDLIIITGDMITGSTLTNIQEIRLKKWKDIIEEYRVPFYICVGNHEIESEMSENIIRSVFEMPENGPSPLKGLVYSFDHKTAHFVILDTNIFNSFHTIGDAQLKWLKEDLEKNKNKRIFVFGHEPAYPVHDHKGSSLDKYKLQRDELWNIFKQYKVKAYFCSHEHLYNRSSHEGVYQIITGGGGASISASKEQGGFYHFLLVEVKDNSAIIITVKDINGIRKDTFSIDY